MSTRTRYERFDAFQRTHGGLGFPLAVRQKYSDDQGGYLAATITYYAFFSIFPLLLVATTILGFLLRHHRKLDQSIVNSALAQLPVIGHDLARHSLRGSGGALAIGIVLALWSGMGVFLAVENAMNHLWGIPFRRRPDFVRARIRALGMLAVLGVGALGTTVLSAAGTVGAAYGITWKIGAIVVSTLLDIGLLWVAFRLLTAKDVSWRQLRGGAIAAGVGWQVLQALGGWYVGHELRHASQHLRNVRDRDRAAHVHLSERARDAARSGGQRRRDQSPMATQLLRRARAAGHRRRPPRTHPARQGRGAAPGRSGRRARRRERRRAELASLR